MVAKNTQNEPTFFEAIQQFSADRGLARDAVMGIIKESLISAYKKRVGIDSDLNEEKTVEIEFNDKNEVVLVVQKKVVEKPKNQIEISLEDAKVIDPNIEINSIIQMKEKPEELSRIISSHVRQLVFQKIREMEKEILYKEYKAKEGELTHGFIQGKRRDTLIIDLGKVEAIMPHRDQNPEDKKFRTGDRIKAIISRVELKKDKFRDQGLVITLSRTTADFVKKLFEMEIPEIYEGQVEIIGIAREPAFRTKIVVKSNREDIDPVGACVGMKGVRIQSIVRELGNERVDIIPYSDNFEEYIVNLVSPAKPLEIRVDHESREAIIIVAEDSIAKAKGTNSSNIKLASRIAQYKLLIKSQSQYSQEKTVPMARQRLEKLFTPNVEKPVVVEELSEQVTPLNEIPGLTKRVIRLLVDGGINDVETLLEMEPSDLAKVSGIGQTTAEHILKLLSESVELVEEA